MEDNTDDYQRFLDNHQIITEQFHALECELNKCYQIIHNLNRENQQLKSKVGKTLCMVKGIIKDYGK